jgi:hypothetical protein
MTHRGANLPTHSPWRIPPQLILTSALLCGVLMTNPARALGASNLVVSAERLFGLYGVHRERDDPGGYDYGTTSLGLMVQPPSSLLVTPRIGIDYFVSGSLSIGGVVGLYSHDSDGPADSSGFLLAPRVGYDIAISRRWGFWPRAGLTFFNQDGPDRDQVALSLDGPFYFMPTATLGFTLGPVIELGFLGEERVGSQDRDYRERVIGAAFGMFGRF